MHSPDNGRPNSRPYFHHIEYPVFDEDRHRTLLPVFFYGMPAPQPLPRRRPHRGQLPDVDPSRAVIIERPSAMARLFAALKRVARRRKPPPLVKPDTTI
jgi:hypothetical protein